MAMLSNDDRPTRRAPQHARPAPQTAGAIGRWRLILGGAGVILFVALAIAVAADAPFVSAFDASMQAVVFPLRGEGATAALTALTHLSGTRVSIVLGAAFMVYLAMRIGKREAIAYAGCAIAGEACIALAKLAVDRMRPIGMNLIEFPADASFPSGHTFAAIAVVSFALFVVIRTHPRMPRPAKGILVAIAIAWPLLIAFTRVYLGAHWPTDIVGSLIAGGCAFLPLATYVWDRFCGKGEATARR